MALLSQHITIVAANTAEFDAIVAAAASWGASSSADEPSLTVTLDVTDAPFVLDG